MFYSKQTGGFYSREIHGDNIPSDSVEITPAEYAALLAGQANGQQIQAAENGFPVLVAPPPEPIPAAVCSPWQIRKALNNQGIRQDVEDAVAASDDQELKDGWEFATEFRSDDPFVLTMGAALGKTEEKTRQLIEYASTL
jgi:hypothetical protein